MKNYQRGQILLIVVLIMTIALTVTLSVATRTITTLRTTTEEESSQRAFSAAEAGIEKSIQNNTNSSGSFTNNTTYQTTITTVGGVDFLLNNGTPILKDNASDVWLSTYPGYTNPWTGTLTLYWGLASDACNASELSNTMAALEIVLISGTRTDPTVGHYAVDPCTPRSNNNQFENIPSGGTTINNQPLAFKKTIDIDSGLLMRVIPLYASSIVGVRGCDENNNNCIALPIQGRAVSSVGSADSTQRKIVGFQENPKLPIQFFPYIIFSPK